MRAAWARQSLTWPGTTARASPMYAQDARMIIVGSITGNSNTIGGGFVYPKANLGGQKGLEMGKGFEMIDGGNFNGAKAYKDAKMCNMMTVNELHKRWVTAAESRALARSLPVSIAAEHCSAAFQLPREHGHHVLEPLPRLHRDDQPVP